MSVFVCVFKHRIMSVHVNPDNFVWVCGCLCIGFSLCVCESLAFLCVCVCVSSEWEFVFVRCLFASTCVTFSGLKLAERWAAVALWLSGGWHQVTISSSFSRNGAAASCRGSEDHA